ncbi:MAG: DNA-directed RNA polymerase subunit delta [Erysipelotrichaceae bacterium]|nr:DNA-directed RNA polymerase subunit delta [Erysipelotrichaceae bacterium]MBR2551556.1 DNA-directed RNA polymerase subunit delta [Erysipelotrichaceae bacterium]
MSTKRALTDLAYEIIAENNKVMSFADLWKDVLDMSEETSGDISQFYTDLTLDGRFVSLKGNTWDLKEKHKFADSFVDVEGLSVEDDEEDEREDGEEEEETIEQEEE